MASWLPWVVACYHRSLFTAHRSLAWSAAGGVLLGIATLAGHIQSTLFIGVAVLFPTPMTKRYQLAEA